MKRLVLFTLCSCVSAFAADSKMAGKWIVSGDVQGYPINETCTLAGPDDKLAGKCTGSRDVDATATFDGTKLTMKHPGEYQGQALTLTFAGKLKEDGTLDGTIDVQPLNYDGTFTAKRETANSPAQPAPAPKPQ